MTGPDPAALRLTVDVATFAAWRAATPGLAVPDEFRVEPPEPAARPGDPGADRPGAPPLPAFVAASFAVHAAARVAVDLRVDDGSVRVVACVSVADDLAAILVRAARSEPGPDWAAGGWVQLALLPSTQVVTEVLSWVPQPALTPPLAGGSMRLVVLGADDAGQAGLASWVERDGNWFRVVPGAGGNVELRPASHRELGEDLTAALVRLLGPARSADSADCDDGGPG